MSVPKHVSSTVTDVYGKVYTQTATPGLLALTSTPVLASTTIIKNISSGSISTDDLATKFRALLFDYVNTLGNIPVGLEDDFSQAAGEQ